MPAREKLSPTEQKLAYVIGLGIVLTLLAFILIALDTIDNSDITTSLLIVGLAIIVLGVIAWLYLMRPWEKFDDLKTPLAAKEQAEHPESGEAKLPAVREAASLATVKPPAVELEAVPEPAPTAKEAKPKAAPAPEPAKPAAPAARTEPDDLTLIEGIGKKTADALRAAGITAFAQIAAMMPDDLERAVKDQGVRLIGTAATWPQQAKTALGGDATEMEELKARVKKGTLFDDLTQIEGVGPKVKQVLNEAGIRTFKELAEATPDQLRSILTAANLKMMVPDSWPQQAGLAAAGDLTGLKALQEKLRGGRD